MKDVIIVGGGLSGLFNAILLSRAGLEVTLIEKKRYPFHRVCGEYISNEVIPFLEKHDLFPHELEPASMEQFQLTSIGGRKMQMALDLGGFGVSRYAWDEWLANLLKKEGVDIREGVSVNEIQFQEDHFHCELGTGEVMQAQFVIGAFGKRSTLDKQQDRAFMTRKSPYLGVKYHIKSDFDDKTVALHNFRNGYCGINKVEKDRYNLCYLTHRDNVRKHGNIPETERRVLQENPYLKDIFRNSEFLLEKPEVINEITFEQKEPVHNHVLMCGDSAGMITPLCGNGMGMAIHSANMLTKIILNHWSDTTQRRYLIEEEYTQSWKSAFEKRLWVGRKIQDWFGHPFMSAFAVLAGRTIKPISRALMKQTHGEPFS
ncbi:MAG: NAD(P)/FAD-dependent oxidoreductase [Cytophagales bacterium]|nr:NAD(P)/FAD-dependent oxidoreductase [Cytophagales bacterium]